VRLFPCGWSTQIWNRLRHRAALLVLMSMALGCGDCVSVNDFVDITDVRPDIENDAGRDSSDPKDSGNTTNPDGGEKDFGPLFDFGFNDADFNQPFAITAVVPGTGPVGGGTMVRIDGTGLEDGSTVFFGSQPVEATLSQGRLVARTPAGSPGPVSVKVLAPDGESRVLTDAFRYVTGLVIQGVSPTRIPTIGGVEVEITGEGFEPNSAVSFSGDPALRVSFVSSGILRALAPPRARGFVDVRVTTPYASAIRARAIEYFVPLEITEITPASGLIGGGDTVVLKGAGFDSTMQVRFDGILAQVVNINVVQQAAQVITPAHGVGLVDVSVSTEFEAATREDGFYYAANTAPILAAIAPGFGPESGGNEALLIGQGLNTAGATFTIGGAAVTVTASTATAARVSVPAGSGLADVVFAVSGVETSRLSQAYSYLPDLRVTAVNPATGSVEGGNQVTLTGKGLVGATVTFGGVEAEVISATDTQITVTVPAHSAGIVDVSVERDGLQAKATGAYTYIDRLEVWGFTPVRGSVAGGTFIQVRGRGFLGNLVVDLDGVVGDAVRRIDQNNLTFLSPPHAEGEAELTVSTGQNDATAPYTYAYFNPASRLGGASGGPVNGAVNVTVYSLGGGPLENAFVMLSTRTDTPYQGFTDINGMITLSGADLLGPQTTTATKTGYSTATIQTVDAENITLFLNILDPPPNPGGGALPPSAAVFGNIKATGKLSDPADQNTYDLAIVGTTTRTIFGNNPSAGPNAIVLGEGRYELNTRIGDMAIVGLCGEFNSLTQVFTPKLMAVKRFVFANDLDRLEHDLVCDIPLDETLTFKLTNTSYAPSGPNTNRADVFWDFGFEGVFRSPISGQSLSNIVSVTNQPKMNGVLDDVRFVAIAGSFTNQGAPFSRAKTERFAFTQNIVSVPPLLDVPLLISPVAGGVVQNGSIRFESDGPYYPDFFYLVLRNDSGIPVWQWVIPGSQAYALLPEFPDFSGLPADIRPAPMVAGALYLSIFAARTTPSFLFETISYREIDNESWTAYSLNATTIQLR
jgi:hypothetical protein